LAIDDQRLKSTLEKYLTQWRHVSPNIDGHDLHDRGLPPGPVYRRILETLRAAWLDGEVRTPEEEETLIRDLIVRHVETTPEE